jgi:hypothetical protein
MNLGLRNNRQALIVMKQAQRNEKYIESIDIEKTTKSKILFLLILSKY